MHQQQEKQSSCRSKGAHGGGHRNQKQSLELQGRPGEKKVWAAPPHTTNCLLLPAKGLFLMLLLPMLLLDLFNHCCLDRWCCCYCPLCNWGLASFHFALAATGWHLCNCCRPAINSNNQCHMIKHIQCLHCVVQHMYLQNGTCTVLSHQHLLTCTFGRRSEPKLKPFAERMDTVISTPGARWPL